MHKSVAYTLLFFCLGMSQRGFARTTATLTHQQPSEAAKVLHVGPGLIIENGNVLPGVGLGVFWKVREFYLGLDSGLFFLRNPVNLDIPAMAAAYYRFPTSSDIVPTLGLGLGMMLAIGDPNFFYVMLSVSPGFEFYLDHDMDLFFRTNLGIIGSAFQFYPQIGATFRI